MPSPASPTPSEIAAFRAKHRLTQAQAAAELALSSVRSWQHWESGERRMHPAIWRWVQHAVETIGSPCNR